MTVRFLFGVFVTGTCIAANTVFGYQELPDPTLPASGVIAPVVTTEEAETGDREDFQLNAIVERKDQFIAIINQQRVKEGERVDGAKVVAIAKRKVTLLTSGKLLVLKLASFGFKTKAN